MKKTICAAAAVFLLCGCAHKTATDSIIESVGRQIDALEKTLPAECRTTAIVAEIAAIKATANTVPAMCEQEKKALRADATKWRIAFFAVLGALIIGGLTWIKNKFAKL